ncbi:hypothetical protein ACGFNU_38790 [Spirillospora sp. NPDC048911]|uniref:hypothetical protein n=1 Tax=Spirillospora sp. NPDC048911 TaxID=3364527 RepID=UPI003710FD10
MDNPGSGERSALILAVAASGIGVLVSAGAGQGPVPRALATRSVGGLWNGDALLAAGLPVAAVVAGLVLIRWWPWLLLAGAALTLPATMVPYLDALQSRPTVGHLGSAGVALVLVAVLAAAQELLDGGRVRAGVALAGSAAGAGLVGAALVGAGWLSMPWRTDALHLGLTVVALAGAGVAVARLQGTVRRWPGVRVTVAGVLATLVAFLPAAVTLDRVTRLLEVSQESLARRPYVMVGMLGLATLIVAGIAAMLAGVWAGTAVLAVAAVQAGTAAPVLLGLSGTAQHRAFAVVAALVGLAAGVAAATTRWRAVLAISGGVACGLVLLLLVAATGGVPEKLITQARWIPAGLLLALLVATVTCTVAAVAPATTRGGGTPAVLGPIAGALAIGGREAITLTQLNDGQPEPSYLNSVHHLGSSAALLFIAALLVAFLAAARFLLAQRDSDTSPGDTHLAQV